MNRLFASAAVLLAMTLSVHADEVDDFIAVARASLTSPHPMIAYYEGVLALPDFDLDAADMQRVVDDVGSAAKGVVGQSLGSITSLRKRGKTLRVERDRATTVHNDDGYTRMGTLVTVEVEVLANGDVVVDAISGISSGRSQSFLFPLRKVVYTYENGAPVARATLGYWPFLRTLTLEVEPPAPPTAGLAGSVPSTP